ncbi:ATP/GTP-binding protein [Paraburkholderia kururiensis]|uniref:ATP/GTP-binding protein n=1 Tax=Paraburkholderia kururiensis TaxID=984307 RepID=UPI0014703422|nr:ATP-binding protein [Paraburkholderia kururiensis]
MPIFDRYLAQLCSTMKTTTNRTRTNWYVVTGPPFSGKTTIVDALSMRGVPTVEDCGRRAINEQIDLGKTKQDIHAQYGTLQVRISDLMLKEAQLRRPEEMVIWDYSFPDNLAYIALTHGNWSSVHVERAIRFQFKKTFLLQPVGDFDSRLDPVRSESLESRTKLYELMRNIYETLGTEVMEVPSATVSTRIEQIENHLVRAFN